MTPNYVITHFFTRSRFLANVFALQLVTVAVAALILCYHVKTVTLSFPLLPSLQLSPASVTTAALAFACIIYRCDMILFALPLLLTLVISSQILKRFPQFAQLTFPLSKVIIAGITASIIALVLTLSVDSYFWHEFRLVDPHTQQPLVLSGVAGTLAMTLHKLGLMWPELCVLVFNAAGQSSHWGEASNHWYFTAALPKGLHLTYLFILLAPVVAFMRVQEHVQEAAAAAEKSSREKAPPGQIIIRIPEKLYMDPHLVILSVPLFAFFFLYSMIPHKEIRFLFPVFPFATAIAARAVLQLHSVMVLAHQRKHVARFGNVPEIVTTGRKLFRMFARLLAMSIIVAGMGVSVSMALISAYNYPGGHALDRLNEHIIEHQLRADTKSQTPVVHLCNLACMSGATRFGELHAPGLSGATVTAKTSVEDERGDGLEKTYAYRGIAIYSKKERVATTDLSRLYEYGSPVAFAVTEEEEVPNFKVVDNVRGLVSVRASIPPMILANVLYVEQQINE